MLLAFSRELFGGSKPRLAAQLRNDVAAGGFDHDDEEHVAAVPTAHPTNSPAVDAVTERHGMEKPEELGWHGVREGRCRRGAAHSFPSGHFGERPAAPLLEGGVPGHQTFSALSLSGLRAGAKLTSQIGCNGVVPSR